ncbi:MAG: membrane protein insertion efficiency factor YidD, partial [Thermodesulfovibrionales bacterium]
MRGEKKLRTVLVALIRSYQYLISPLFPASCRFSPTCSEYSREAIMKYGAFKGMLMSIKRIL